MKLRNVIFYVRDIDRSKGFYEKLGFEIAQDFGKFVSYKTDVEDLYFSIMEANDSEKTPGKQVCVFWASDIKTLYQKMAELKVEIETKLYKAPFGETFAIRDLDGSKSNLCGVGDEHTMVCSLVCSEKSSIRNLL